MEAITYGKRAGAHAADWAGALEHDRRSAGSTPLKFPLFGQDSIWRD
jgi:hypothetical protein